MRSSPGTTERDPRRGRFASLALAAVAAACVAAWLAPLGWPFELFVHFRVQTGVAAGLLAAVLLLRRRPVPAALGAALAAIQLWPAALPAHVFPGACTGDQITVVTVNLSYRNPDPQLLIDWLTSNSVDLVLLQELTPAWVAALERLPGYPHRRLLVRTDPYGVGVLSRWPTDGLVALDLAADGLPSLVGPLQVGRKRLMLGVVHTHWPLLPGLMSRRDKAVSRVAQEVRRHPGPWIVGGDFNLTPYSPVFRRLLEESGLQETRSGGTWAPSWRADLWPLAIRIDHVLVTRELCAEPSEVGPEIGSDHRPVRVRLRLPG